MGKCGDHLAVSFRTKRQATASAERTHAYIWPYCGVNVFSFQNLRQFGKQITLLQN